jgi:cytoskeletal protein RodZ
MEPEQLSFEEFFARKIKEKGFSLKRLSDATGIAPVHLENMLRGDFANMPSAPYFHGYLMRLGKMLDFDGEEWWVILKKEGAIKNSGETDAMPKNRFIKKAPPKFLWAIGATVIILIYLGFQAPRIFGKPSLALSFPASNPFTTSSSTLTITGTVQNAETLTLNGDAVTIASDGSWQKGVLLQSGLNTFQITAKKFLGSEADIVEQIVYTPAGNETLNAASGSPIIAPGAFATTTTSTFP